jgi:hypothetical protein
MLARLYTWMPLRAATANKVDATSHVSAGLEVVMGMRHQHHQHHQKHGC